MAALSSLLPCCSRCARAIEGKEGSLLPRRTKSGRKTAVADVEDKLKAEYPGNPDAVYGTLNKIKLKRGSKTTAKGMKPAKSKSRGRKARS